MAEIPIERKPARNWLPIILAVLALLLLLGYCSMRNRGASVATTAGDTTSTRAAMTDTTNRTAANTTAAATGAGAAIDQFVQFTQQTDTTKESEGQHQYTAEGTRRLAAALEALAGSGTNISAYADSMRSSINRLQSSSPNDVHSEDAKAAFSAAVSAMDQINHTRGTTRDVAPMRAIYNELDSKQPLMPQRPKVERFFKAAADALQSMRS